MHYAVRMRWEIKEKDRKQPSIGGMTRIYTAATEDEARLLALDWHKRQGYGGKAVIETIDELPGADEVPSA